MLEVLGLNVEPMDAVVALVGVSVVLTYAWSLKYHFDMPVTPPGVRVISTLVTLSSFLLLYLGFVAEQPLAAQGSGLLAMLASYGLFWMTIRASRSARLLAAFDEDLPHFLLQSGPYAWVRHPFYVSYLLLWSGWGIAVWNLWGLVPVVAMGTTYYFAAREEEAKFASTHLAGAYRQYSERTGRFFPRIGRVSAKGPDMRGDGER